jgi:Na+-transporting NADH:ubiquinone oxidoreductase subunit A
MRIDLKRGLDVRLGGAPEQLIRETLEAERTALVLDDYHDLRPALAVAVGDRVALGQKLLVDRRHPEVAYTAFHSGVVREIRRGARRHIRHLVVEHDGEEAVSFAQHSAASVARLSATAVREVLLASGAWTALRARPFDRVASPAIEPRALFVTAMDTNPLAPDPAVVLTECVEEFAVGLTAVSKLTAGSTFVCTAPGAPIPVPDSECLLRLEIGGPHPAGLPGTHMHASGLEIRAHPDLWYVGYQDVAAMGKLLLGGRVAAERIVAIAGPAARQPRLVRTRLGTELAGWSEEAAVRPCRIISGSPLSGTGCAAYLGRYHKQVTFLPEPAREQARSWIAAVSDILRGARVGATSSTAQNGAPSGMLPLEIFELVWPFRRSPVPLLRALLTGDEDGAVRLGCLGLAEEDLALCGYVCPAKRDYATALRETLRSIERLG